MSHRAKNQ